MAKMTYAGVEWMKAAWGTPLQSGLRFGAQAMRSSPLAMAMGGRELAALWDVAGRLAKHYEKPLWREDEWGYPVEIKKIWGTPFGNLIRFKQPGAEERPKLLIVAPMSGHYPTLLRQTVKEMGHAHDVFLTEWINPRDVPLSDGDFSLDSYVDFLRQSMRELAALDARPAHAMSVCQPTVPMLAAASLMWEDKEAAAPASLVMIGGPIDARLSPTATNNFALKHPIEWFESTLINWVPSPHAGAGRKVYPGFLQHMGFVAMNPSRHAKAHRQYFRDLLGGEEAAAEKHRAFYDEYNAVMDLAAPYYLETVKKVFQDFDLPQGRLMACGRLVKPEAVKGFLMTIEGELDDISGAGQTHSAQRLCSGIASGSREERTFEGVGHYGVFSGSSFVESVAPAIGAFIQKCEAELISPSKPAAKDSEQGKQKAPRKAAKATAAKTPPQA